MPSSCPETVKVRRPNLRPRRRRLPDRRAASRGRPRQPASGRYIRKQPHGRLFITRDPHDTIFFPTGHPRSGTPRYRWERQDGGVELGWLLEAGG